jgi:hypothetical protein
MDYTVKRSNRMNERIFPHSLVFAPAFFLGGCLSGNDGGNERREGPLYSCIGEPGYAPGTMESLKEFFDKHPPVCVDGKDMQMGSALAKSAAYPDSILLRTYVMDSQCNFIKQSSDMVPVRDSARPSYPVLFDGKNANGASLPTGEYYVNTVLGDNGNAPDTTYSKIGWVKDRCAP